MYLLVSGVNLNFLQMDGLWSSSFRDQQFGNLVPGTELCAHIIWFRSDADLFSLTELEQSRGTTDDVTD